MFHSSMTEEQLLNEQFVILKRLVELKHQTVHVKKSSNPLADALGVNDVVGLTEKTAFDGTRRGTLDGYLTESVFTHVGDERYVKANSRSTILNRNKESKIKFGTNCLDEVKGLYLVTRTA